MAMKDAKWSFLVVGQPDLLGYDFDSIGVVLDDLRILNQAESAAKFGDGAHQQDDGGKDCLAMYYGRCRCNADEMD
jgi:hypothetical protein